MSSFSNTQQNQEQDDKYNDMKTDEYMNYKPPEAFPVSTQADVHVKMPLLDDMPVPLPLPTKEVSPPPIPRRRSNDVIEQQQQVPRSFTPPIEKRKSFSPPGPAFHQNNEQYDYRQMDYGNRYGNGYQKYNDNQRFDRRETPSYYRN